MPNPKRENSSLSRHHINAFRFYIGYHKHVIIKTLALGSNEPSSMSIPIEYLLLGASVLLILSVVGSTASGRLGFPALLLFLLVGMLAGADGFGGFDFNYPWLAQSLGVLALSLILFFRRP